MRAFGEALFSRVPACVGGEVAYALDKRPLSEIALDGRYNLGFAKLGDLPSAEFEDVSTSAFTGTLSLRFDL